MLFKSKFQQDYLDYSQFNKKRKKRATLEGHTDIVSGLIELKNGDVISRSYDESIKVWIRDNWKTRSLLKNFHSSKNLIQELFSNLIKNMYIMLQGICSFVILDIVFIITLL